MTDIQSFFCFIGLVAFCLLLMGLVVGAIYLIGDYYTSKVKIENLENKYCDLYNNLRDVEITIDRLETKTDNIIKETTVNDN